MMRISLIVAMDLQRGIGKGNQLPWHYPEDLKYFREKTLGHTVVMGRKTFESIGKELPSRRNIVLSSSSLAGIECYPSKEAFLAAYQSEIHDQDEKIFVIGGAQTYESFLESAEYIYLTQIKESYECDRFFPLFESDFVCVEKTASEDLDFLVYARK